VKLLSSLSIATLTASATVTNHWKFPYYNTYYHNIRLPLLSLLSLLQ